MPSGPRVVHGDDLIYRVLRDLFADDAQFGGVPRALLTATAVWFPLPTYQTAPVLAPYLVRDPSCRGGRGEPEAWSSPDALGYLRDDNSLIKSIPRALPIAAPAQRHLNGRRMATEFVAAHVWRVTADGGPLASRRPLLNSFVPNIVWLPKQIAKLTDIEGAVVQRTLQEMSWAYYRQAPVEPHLEPVVEEAWSLLPQPHPATTHDYDTWNHFVPTERFYATRRANIDKVLTAVQAVLRGDGPDGKVISTRYTDGLPSVSAAALGDLQTHLSRFVAP